MVGARLKWQRMQKKCLCAICAQLTMLPTWRLLHTPMQIRSSFFAESFARSSKGTHPPTFAMKAWRDRALRGNLPRMRDSSGKTVLQRHDECGDGVVSASTPDGGTRPSYPKTLPEYAAWVKEQVPKIDQGSVPVRVVLGNEAGDTDSMVSALILAFFLWSSEGVAAKSPVFPVINFPSDELRLRKDNVELLEVVGIEKDRLVFVEEVPLKQLAIAGRLELTLVDHNELSPLQDFLANAVVGVVDHHQDADLYAATVRPGRKNVVFPTGSCASLVAQAMLKSDVGRDLLADPAINLLIRSTIMLDTGCLADEFKTTDLDREMLNAIPAEKAWGDYSDLEWHKRLKSLRADMSGFSGMDMMKKDLKFASGGDEKFAVASVPATLKSMGVSETKDALKVFAAEMKALIERHDLSSAFLLAPFSGNKKHLVAAMPQERWAQASASFEQAIARAKEHGGIAMNGSRADWGVDRVGHALTAFGVVIALFSFDATVSRKQIMPGLQAFFEKTR